MTDAAAVAPPRRFTLVMLWASLATVLAEVLTMHSTDDARRAMSMIVGRPFGAWFWGGGILLGHLLPLLLLSLGGGLSLIAPAAVLAGMFAIERVWVLAPQRIPLS